MLTPEPHTVNRFEQVTTAERAQLLKLCTCWTSDPNAAEDIVQETLLVGWQQQHQLRDPARRPQWLTGIARNLCRHWARHRQREERHWRELPVAGYGAVESRELVHGETFDVEVELDRRELARLLDRALALLPPLTRAVLIERFIHDTPQAEVATGLGLSEGAVEARVQRGKLTLRRLFTTELQTDAAAYGFIPTDELGWQETRIWCPACGERRLQGRFTSEEPSTFTLRCICGLNNCLGDVPGLFTGVHGFRAALTRVKRWQQQVFQAGISTGYVTCPRCGTACPFHLTPNSTAATDPTPPEAVAFADYGYQVACPACRSWRRQVDLEGVIMNFPVVQQFWRDHPRMMSLPLRVGEVDGTPVIIASVADKTGSARLELLVQPATFALLGVQ